MKQLVLLTITFLACQFFYTQTMACDDSSADFLSITSIGGNQYTIELDVCIEFNGLEGNPDAFSFNFNPGTIAVQSGFTPASIATSSNDIYTGAISGNELLYSTSSTFTAHNSATICNTYTITVSGYPTSVMVITHQGNSASACNRLVTIPALPASPCDCGSTASCDGVALADQTAAVNAYNTATMGSTGCYDLTSEGLSAEGTESYEFCFEYTHSSAAPEFSFNSLVGILDVGSCINNSTITQSAYEVGVCGSPIASTGTTTDGWATYPATNGTSYRLCTVVDPDENECCGDILSVCTFAHPTEIPPCTLMPLDNPDLEVCNDVGTITLSAGFMLGTNNGTVLYDWSMSDPAIMALAGFSVNAQSMTLTIPTSYTTTAGGINAVVQITDDNCDGTTNLTDTINVIVNDINSPECAPGCTGTPGFIDN